MTIIDSVRVISFPTADEFLAATTALREAEPLVTNVLSTLATARANATPDPDHADLWLAVLADTGAVVGAAVRLPPRAMVVSRMPDDAVTALAEFVATASGAPNPGAPNPDVLTPDMPNPEIRDADLTNPDAPRSHVPALGIAGFGIPGVDGPLPTSETFARTYSRITGMTVTTSLDQRMLAATSINPPTGIPGTHRFATMADRDLIVGWVGDFTREAVPDQPRPAAADIERRLRGVPTMTLWTVDGVPVSICSETRPVAGVVRVALVYTPPEHRGHGYAAANVAAVSRRAIAAGATCLLYTDRSNPTSNRLYERIGYTFVADAMLWMFGR